MEFLRILTMWINQNLTKFVIKISQTFTFYILKYFVLLVWCNKASWLKFVPVHQSWSNDTQSYCTSCLVDFLKSCLSYWDLFFFFFFSKQIRILLKLKVRVLTHFNNVDKSKSNKICNQNLTNIHILHLSILKYFVLLVWCNRASWMKFVPV